MGATILMLAYGYSAEIENDALVKIAEKAMLGFSKASEPGAYVVDRFPWRNGTCIFFTVGTNGTSQSNMSRAGGQAQVSSLKHGT